MCILLWHEPKFQYSFSILQLFTPRRDWLIKCSYSYIYRFYFECVFIVMQYSNSNKRKVLVRNMERSCAHIVISKNQRKWRPWVPFGGPRAPLGAPLAPWGVQRRKSNEKHGSLLSVPGPLLEHFLSKTDFFVEKCSFPS